jgi:hypothetical protein
MANNKSQYSTTTTSGSNSGLEPRVAKLETGLEILTRDVTTLANVVREQGSNIEHEIQRLAVGVTQAAGPRKTDWSTIISAVMLILALGSAVFWPLNQTAQNNKGEIQSLQVKFEDHQKLDNHPVGVALLGRLEEQLKLHIEDNNRQIRFHADFDDKEFKALDDKLQREFVLANKTLEQKVADLEKEITMLNDRTHARLTKIELNNDSLNKADLDELRLWRQKVSGLSSPSATVPLIPRDGSSK